MGSLDEISHATWNSREHERSKYSSWKKHACSTFKFFTEFHGSKVVVEIPTGFPAKTLNNTRSLDFLGFSFWWGPEIWQTHRKNGTPPVVLARFGWPWWAGKPSDATQLWFPSWKIHGKFMEIHWHHWNRDEQSIVTQIYVLHIHVWRWFEEGSSLLSKAAGLVSLVWENVQNFGERLSIPWGNSYESRTVNDLKEEAEHLGVCQSSTQQTMGGLGGLEACLLKDGSCLFWSPARGEINTYTCIEWWVKKYCKHFEHWILVCCYSSLYTSLLKGTPLQWEVCCDCMCSLPDSVGGKLPGTVSDRAVDE